MLLLGACIGHVFGQIIDTNKGKKVITKTVRKNKKRVSQEISTKARDFILRKVNDIGVNKKKTLDDSASSNLGLPISDSFKLSPMKVKANSHSDKKVHAFFKKEVECLPTVSVFPDKWSIRHAYIAPEKIIVAIITVCYVTQELHAHWCWFYKKSEEGDWVPDVNHVKFVNFFDGFAYQNGLEPAFINALEVLNLPALVHHPAFNFLQSIFNDTEGSDTCYDFFSMFEVTMLHLGHVGVDLFLQGYDQTWVIPKTNIPLNCTANNKHHIRLHMGLKADLKGRLLKHGCVSSNQEYTPDVKLDKEERQHPDFKVTRKNWVSLDTKLKDFDKMQKFIGGQRKKLEKEKAKIMKLKVNEEQKQKKLANAEHRLCTVAVNEEAKRLKTCCIHCKPTSDTSVFGTCTVHMEPNEWWRVISRVEVLARELTLKHFRCQKIYKQVKKLNTAASKTGKKIQSTLSVPVPDIATCSPEASTVRFFEGLKKMGLSKVSKRLLPKYTLAIETLSKEEEEKRKLNKTVRLIGEDCWKLMPHTPLLLECLEPYNFYKESVLEFQNRVVMLCYVHCMKCLGGIFGQFAIEVQEDEIGAAFVSHIFNWLVYFFDLHHSLNTFYFGKVSAFLLMHIFKIST